MSDILAVDCSNWDGELTPAFCNAVRAAGVGLVIVRASLEHASGTAARPTGAAQLARLARAGTNDLRPITRQQLGMLAAHGIPTGIYCWQYLSWDPVQTIKDTRALVDGFDIRLAAPDCEELTDIGTPAENIAWLEAALGQMDVEWPVVPIYTGAWWWVPYMGNTTVFAARKQWGADYDKNPDRSVYVPYGGLSGPLYAKQFEGSGGGRMVGGLAVDWSSVDPSVLALPAPPPPTPSPLPGPTPATVDGGQLRYLLASMQKQVGNPNYLDGIKADLLELEQTLQEQKQ